MGVEVNIRLELSSEVADYLSSATGGFDSVENYVEDLIRRDMELVDAVTLANIDELRRAFATPSAECVTVTLEEVIERNRRRRA